MPWSRAINWSSYYQIPEELCSLYLKRLGVDKQEPSREYLDELVRIHQMKIPFENLDTTYYHKPVSIEPSSLVRKILIQNRGGFCFELNGIFSLFLQSLGFKAHMCPCRQLRHREACPVPATHCGIIVDLDGQKLFCDVGYGGPAPSGAIILQTEEVQTIAGERFYLKNADEQDGWRTLYRISSDKDKEDLPLIRIAPIECYLCDFYGQTLLRSQGPSAYADLHVSIKTENGGFINLQNDQLRIKAGSQDTVSTITDDALPRVLERYFGIHSE